ncbi:MAG: GGDEF domain-containing protein [Eubacteriales bacterium]|nr:GGDEF domain-containing protein [Eubacteriales bacterium]
MSSAVLYAEVSFVCILFLLLISIRAGRSAFPQSQRRGLLAVAASNMLLFALDAVWIFVNSDMLSISVTWNWLLNGMYYAVSGLVGYIWFCFSEGIQQSRFVRNKKCWAAALLPAVVLIVLTGLSYYNRLLFYIDADNLYHRGPAYSLQLFLAYGYVIFAAVKAYIRSFKTDDYRKKMELKALAGVAVPSLLAGAVQVVFPKYPILCVGSTFAVMYVYLSLQEQLVSLDALTQLNNRSQLFQYMSTRFRHMPENRTLYLLMLDINSFKAINDQYGHTEGDRALTLVADCLKKSCGQRNFFIARYGGDEFTVVCEVDDDASVEAVYRRIHAQLSSVDAPYPLTVSIGCAQYTPAIRAQQELIALADKELYKAKKLYHGC